MNPSRRLLFSSTISGCMFPNSVTIYSHSSAVVLFPLILRTEEDDLTEVGCGKFLLLVEDSAHDIEDLTGEGGTELFLFAVEDGACEKCVVRIV